MDEGSRLPDLLGCPDPECRAPAELIERFDLCSTDGPLPHVVTRCVRLHTFTVPESTIDVDLDPRITWPATDPSRRRR
jgi:hypothetical protein